MHHSAHSQNASRGSERGVVSGKPDRAVRMG